MWLVTSTAPFYPKHLEYPLSQAETPVREGMVASWEATWIRGDACGGWVTAAVYAGVDSDVGLHGDVAFTATKVGRVGDGDHGLA